MQEIEKKYSKIIELIIKRTKEKGWSYNKLANVSGISVPMIYKIVAYTSTPSVMTLLQILRVLDLKLEVK